MRLVPPSDGLLEQPEARFVDEVSGLRVAAGDFAALVLARQLVKLKHNGLRVRLGNGRLGHKAHPVSLLL